MNTQKPDLLDLWNTMEINAAVLPMVQKTAKMVAAGRSRYQTVSKIAAEAIPDGSYCPWYVIGLLHLMECGLNWTKHLHNGDPLTARTTHVPAGRPKKGNPPFTWEQSAIDAIRMQDLNNATYDWASIPFTLQKLEEYNGLGYRRLNIYSPYIWSMTNHYSRGKYVADGHFDPAAVSTQVGCAPVLEVLLEQFNDVDI